MKKKKEVKKIVLNNERNKKENLIKFGTKTEEKKFKKANYFKITEDMPFTVKIY